MLFIEQDHSGGLAVGFARRQTFIWVNHSVPRIFMQEFLLSAVSGYLLLIA